MKNPEYYIREKDNLFEVAKFDGTKEPVEVYVVNPMAGTCTCWAGMRMYKGGMKEKHVKMVVLWQATGRPDPWTWNRIRKIGEEHGM